RSRLLAVSPCGTRGNVTLRFFSGVLGGVYVSKYHIRRLNTCVKEMDKRVFVGFISAVSTSNGGIAQLVERLVRNEKARGSNPLTSSLRSRRYYESGDCRAVASA